MSNMVDKAAAVARAAHAGQTDKAGRRYFIHPARVASRVRMEQRPLPDPEVVAAAYLHDVVEDTAVTLDDLEAMGFSGRVVTIVDALTRRPGERHEAAVCRAARNPDARLVKRCDVAENADPDRLALLDEKTRARLTEKYRRAAELLDAADECDHESASGAQQRHDGAAWECDGCGARWREVPDPEGECWSAAGRFRVEFV